MLLMEREQARTMGNEDPFADDGGSNRATSRHSEAAVILPQVGIRSGVRRVDAEAQIQPDRTSFF